MPHLAARPRCCPNESGAQGARRALGTSPGRSRARHSRKAARTGRQRPPGPSSRRLRGEEGQEGSASRPPAASPAQGRARGAATAALLPPPRAVVLPLPVSPAALLPLAAPPLPPPPPLLALPLRLPTAQPVQLLPPAPGTRRLLLPHLPRPSPPCQQRPPRPPPAAAAAAHAVKRDGPLGPPRWPRPSCRYRRPSASSQTIRAAKAGPPWPPHASLPRCADVSTPAGA